MKYIILEKRRHEIDWTIRESIEDVREFLEGRPVDGIRVFELGKEIEIKLNEVPFKGLTDE